MTAALPSNLRPTLANIIVQIPKPKETTEHGIYIIPNRDNDSTVTKAKVLALGPGRLNPHTGQHIPIKSVKVGDYALYHSFKAYKFADEKKNGEIAFITEDDILAVLEES